MSSTLLLMVVSTEMALVPSMPIWLNILATSSNPPWLFMESSSASTASFASFFTRSANCFTSMPASCANFFVSLAMLVSSWLNAVLLISSCSRFSSITAAKDRMSACVMLSCFPTPATLAVKSTR